MNTQQKAIVATAIGGIAYAVLTDETSRKTITKVAEATMNVIPDTITINTKPAKMAVKNKVETMTNDTINLVEDADVVQPVN